MTIAVIHCPELDEMLPLVNLGTGYAVVNDCPLELLASQGAEILFVGDRQQVLERGPLDMRYVAAVPTGNGAVDLVVPLSSGQLGEAIERRIEPIRPNKGLDGLELKQLVKLHAERQTSTLDSYELTFETGTQIVSGPESPVGSWVCWIIRCQPDPGWPGRFFQWIRNQSIAR